MASIAVIAFAVGAVLTNFLMRHSLVNPPPGGHTAESQYFSEAEVSRAFQRQLAARQVVDGSKWMGFEATQNPLDLWILQEIITEIKPDVIIETGTGGGGSALAFATILAGFKHGQVHTVGIQQKNPPQHSRIAYHTGSSTDAKVFDEIRSKVKDGDRTLVVLDSSHEHPQVLHELTMYAPLVSIGSYVVVHSTQLRPGTADPSEAVDAFLKQNRNFEADKSRERFGATAYPNGWLKRVR